MRALNNTCRFTHRGELFATRYVREIESQWLVVYFGVYLSILMGTYLLRALESKFVPFYILALHVVLLAFLSFLLVCTVHEIGHYTACKLKGYATPSIQVWLYLLPIGVNHPKSRSSEDVAVLCLSGPFAGLVASLILGYILFLSIPTALSVAAIMIVSAVALGYRDYKQLLKARHSSNPRR